MRITEYSFGRIVIDGRVYTSDVIIYPGRVDSSWWRKEGHYLQPEDLADVVAAKPDIVVLGTGHSGIMQVPEKTRDYLTSKGIEVYAEKTGKAVEVFNRLSGSGSSNISGEKTVIAALHLTC